MAAEHTPGPWKRSCFLVIGADGKWVCHTGMGGLPPSESHVSEANARLIAAAPELLLVVANYLVLGKGKCIIGKELVDRALAAVKIATEQA